jgi:hypothetical protein
MRVPWPGTLSIWISPPLARLLGGVERLEDLGRDFGRHAAAGVRHREAHASAVRAVAVVAQAEVQPAGALHRIARIDRHVEDRVLQLVAVHIGAPQVPWRIDVQGDAVTQRALQQGRHVPQQAAEVRHHGLQGLVARKGQQLERELGSALHRRDGVPEA